MANSTKDLSDADLAALLRQQVALTNALLEDATMRGLSLQVVLSERHEWGRPSPLFEIVARLSKPL